MRRILLLLAIATSALALPPNLEKVDSFRGIDQYRLKSNGMTILLVPDHTSPVFTFMVVYHVGSRNEAPGNTGSAHLLEHMIFNKSTENFGKARGHKTFQETLYEAGADFASTNMTTRVCRTTSGRGTSTPTTSTACGSSTSTSRRRTSPRR